MFNQVTANAVGEVVDQELIEHVLVPGLFQFFDQAGRRHESTELENGAGTAIDAELERDAPRILRLDAPGADARFEEAQLMERLADPIDVALQLEEVELIAGLELDLGPRRRLGRRVGGRPP